MERHPRSRLARLLGFGLILLLLVQTLFQGIPPTAAVAAVPPGTRDLTVAKPGDTTRQMGPAVVVEPSALAVTLPPDDIATQTLWISNTGDAPLSFTIHEATRTLALASDPGFRPRAEPVVDPAVPAQLQTASRARVLIYLRELADLAPAYAIRDRAARGRFVYVRLQETAARSGGDLRNLLEEAGAEPQVLLATNAIAATLDAALLEQVAARPEVAAVKPDLVVSISPPTAAEQAAAVQAVEWNIARIRADQAWSTFGVTGQGVTVGNIGTGVMYDHAALVQQYRGNLGGGSFDHNYNWFDFVSGQPVPYDDNGHSTYGVGIAVGDDGGANQIGVAPGAKWIAVKACTGGGMCSQAELHAAMQWMLAPTNLTGTLPLPERRPQVVLTMLGSAGCDNEFRPEIQAWLAADILPVFSPGTNGPACGGIGSPADLPESFAAGSTDSNDIIADFSARGPSCYGEIKPDVAAPGVDVRSSYNDGSYTTWSGSAAAAAHLAGVVALVRSADPTRSTSEVEYLITSTALCIEDLSCGGTPCPGGANNSYGWGRIDAYEAVSATVGGQTIVDIPWLAEAPISGTLAPDAGMPIAVTFNAAGLAPGVYKAALDVESNDPLNPLVQVPVTLTVQEPCQPVQDADFTWTPPTPAAGQAVTLTATASGTAPITYTWDLGDDTQATGAVVHYSYHQPGAYRVVMTATNCAHVPVTAVHTITVVLSCDPVTATAFAWAPPTPAAGQIVTFTATASGTAPITYTWDLGDDTPAAGAVVRHSYDQAGTYTVTLTATNCAHIPSTAVHIVTVVSPCTPVTATEFAWTPLTPTVGAVITFTAAATGTGPITFAWSFGDGALGYGATVTHTYALSSSYTVVLTATNGCGSAVVSHLLEVLPKPPHYQIYLPLVLKGFGP